MKRWHKVVDDLTFKDGSTVKEYGLVFETTDKALSKRVEKFFQSLMDEAETVPLNTPLSVSDYNVEVTYSTREDSVFVITKAEPQRRNCADFWNWDEDEPQTKLPCDTCANKGDHDGECSNCVSESETIKWVKASHYRQKDKPQTDCSWGVPDGEI